MNSRSILDKLSYLTVFIYGIFLSNGCEPMPKMISYGSNEHSQLEFDGTNFEHQPLFENYNQVWAGENFSLAFLQGTGYPSTLFCKGDSSLGQCDLPDSVSIMVTLGNLSYSYTDLKLGFNHGLLSYTYAVNPPNLPTNGTNLIAWGDNTYGQAEVPDSLVSGSILMTAVGGNHNAIVTDDDQFVRVISWGDNSHYQCDVPERFNPVSDSLEIVFIDAGANHTIITYDSSGFLKMAAWGDNSSGQLNVPTEEELNGSSKFLAMSSGYYHNFAIFYDETINYSDQLLQGNIVDTLFTQVISDSGTNWSFHPVTILLWGDNAYGQLDVPSMDGLLESWDAGGYHSSIAVARDWMIGSVPVSTDPYTGEVLEQVVSLSSGREIVGWGKNDFQQTTFPVEYQIKYESYSSESANGPYGGFTLWQNPPPQIALGGHHTLISSRQLYRSPMLDYTFPNQFQGSLGDTVYQNITFKNIGPDTLFIDSIFVNPQYAGENSHPFYLDGVDVEYILFGDSISFDLYCVYDSTHALNIYSNIIVTQRGWFEESISIPINSLFGPQVRLSTLEYFKGSSGEIISQPLTIFNEGSQTVFLDSIFIPAPYTYEPFEENYINPGDSLVIDLVTVLEELPAWNQAAGTLFISNFNTVTYSLNIASMRYLVEGDHLNYGYWMLNRNHANCNSYPGNWEFSDPAGMFNNLNFYNVAEFYTNLHHFDFGYDKTDNRELYAQQMDSLYNQFRENSYFVSLLGLGNDSNTLLPWSSNSEGDCDTLSMQFDFHSNPVFFQDLFSENVFEDWVESVLVDQDGVITYLDTFNIESLMLAVENELTECGYDCLPDNAVNMEADTIEVAILLGEIVADTILIENITEHSVDYSVETQSGISVANSIIFNEQNDQFWFPANNSASINLNPPFSFSFWLKPMGSFWNNDGVPDKFISASNQDFDQTDFWRIVLTDDEGSYPQIGWMDEDSYFLATTPLVDLEWYHVALVVEDSSQNISIYINGDQEVDETLMNDIPTINNLRINEGNSQEFNGFLSQTASWNTALNDTEVMEIFEMGPDAELRNNIGDYNSSPDLLFYYKMDAGYGSYVEDVSGNDFHATKYGLSTNWSTENIQTGISWLSTFGGETGTVPAGENRLINFYANSEGLEIGSYVGYVNLFPDHNPYVVENTVIILDVTEELSTSIQNLPNDYALYQNYPNPFNPITKIHYNLPDVVKVKIDIYDIRGRKVRSLLNQFQEPGFKSIQWNASNDLGEKVSSGMYFYRIETQDFKQTKKMILLK